MIPTLLDQVRALNAAHHPRQPPRRPIRAPSAAIEVNSDCIKANRNGQTVSVCRQGTATRTALDLAAQKGVVSAAMLIDRFGIVRSTAATAIQRLLELAILEPDAQARPVLAVDRLYRLTARAAEALAEHQRRH